MIKRVYLHIGLHKTATTSIQQALADNNKLLAQNNYLYPVFRINNDLIINHSIPFYCMYSKNPERYHYNIGIGSNTIESAKQNNTIFLNQLRKQINTFEGENLIISGEDISRLPIEQLIDIKNTFIDELGKNIEFRIVAFVRHPVAFFESTLQEFVKHGGTIENFFAQKNTIISNNYRSKFEKFINVFNLENINVYRFEDAIEYAYGVSGFFLQAIGLPENIQKKIPSYNLNRSTSYESIVLLSAINKVVPLYINGEKNPKRNKFFQYQLQKLPGERFCISVSNKLMVWQQSQPDLIWLYSVFHIEKYQYQLSHSKNEIIYWNEHTINNILSSLINQPSHIKEIIHNELLKQIDTNNTISKNKRKEIIKQINGNQEETNLARPHILNRLNLFITWVSFKIQYFAKKILAHSKNSKR